VEDDEAEDPIAAEERRSRRSQAAAAQSVAATRSSLSGGIWQSLRAACIAYVLRNYAAVRASPDWTALPARTRAGVARAYAHQRHAYRFDVPAALASLRLRGSGGSSVGGALAAEDGAAVAAAAPR